MLLCSMRIFMLCAGVAVSSMMFGTTLLMFMVMLIIWETNVFLATAFLLFFGFIDMVYTSGLPLLELTTCWPTVLVRELPNVFQIAQSIGHAQVVTVLH